MIGSRSLMVVLCSAALMGTRMPAQAQVHSVSLEGRLGVTAPTGDLSDAGVHTGIALAGEIMYSPSRVLTLYGGLSRDTFDCNRGEACESDFTSTGVQGGAKFLLHREGNALPWVRIGLVGQTLDTGPSESDFSLGFEAGAGIDVALTPHFSLVPGIHFRDYSADFGATDLTASYFVVALGAHLHLQ